MVAELDQVVADHPSIVKLISIGKTWQNRDIWAMKISDNPYVEEAGEPEVYFNSAHHSREWMTIEVALFIIKTLTDGYGTNATITSIVDTRQIWIIPCVNADGRVYDGAVGGGDDPTNHAVQPYGWRRNVRDNNNNMIFDPPNDGVDLNRNYGYMWGGAGATTDITYDTYGGPYGFSEPETQAVRDFCLQHDFVVAISYHSAAGLILYPEGWNFVGNKDTTLLQNIAKGLSSRITNTALDSQPYYIPMQSSGLYATTGSDDDWLYGELGVLAFCIELYPSDEPASPYDSFHPPDSKIVPVCNDNIAAALWLCQIAGNPYVAMDHVTVAPERADVRIADGTSMDITVNVTADGMRGGTFAMGGSVPGGWPALSFAPTSIALTQGQTGQTSVRISVPALTSPGTYTVLLDATLGVNTTCKGAANITVVVPPNGDAAMASQSPFEEQGTYPLGKYTIQGLVENRGESPITSSFSAYCNITRGTTLSTRVLFSDTMESGTTKWMVRDFDGTKSSSYWHQVTTTSHSATHSWYCGPTTPGNYAYNTVQIVEMVPSVDLRMATGANLTYWTRYSTQDMYDFFNLEASGDGGETWETIARYTGSGTTWTNRTTNLASIVGGSEAKIRFKFSSRNQGTVSTGPYFDDVYLSAQFPTEVPFFGPSGVAVSPLAVNATSAASWVCNFTQAGTYRVSTWTAYGSDGKAENNRTDRVIHVDDSMSLPIFDGVTALANPGMGTSVSVYWDAATQINTPITYRVFRFDHAPSVAEIDAATPMWSGAATSWNDAGVVPGQTYHYAVRATDAFDQAEHNALSMSITPGLAVEHWGPSGTVGNQTRYLRGVANEATVNSLTSYSLGLTNSATAGNWAAGNSVQVHLGIRVWKRSSAGTETEVTPGSAQALVHRTATGNGFQTATWTPTQTSLAATDSIVVRVYGDTTTPPTTVRATFTTEQLGATQLDASPWTVQYWTRYANTAGGGSDWYWGTTTYDNHISGFRWSVASNPLDHNTLNWTTGSIDAAGYNIYRSDSQAGPWDASHLIETVAADEFTYVDVDKGQADSTHWWYVVRAVDGYGLEETNTNAVQEPGAGTSTTAIPVAAGWNLISIPLSGPTAMPEALTDSLGGATWSRAIWYNPNTPGDPWKQYNTGWAAGLNDLVSVDHKAGVWLYVTAVGDGKLDIGGAGYSAPSSTAISLKAGWNLVGFPSDDVTYTAGQFRIDIGQPSAVVERFDWAATYKTATMGDAELFVNGGGYWVYTPVDVVWTKPY
jgi:hypothetical protein